MRFLHSIRWRLQLWHGILLVIVLVGFGSSAYQLERVNRFRRIDQDLQQRASMVAAMLRRSNPNPPGRPPRPEGRDFPPPNHFPPRDGRPPFDGPSEGRPPPFDGPEGRRLPMMQLDPQDSLLFDASVSNGFYYVLWFRDGSILSKSASAPTQGSMPDAAPGHEGVRTRGHYREVFHVTPPGECILTGHDISLDLVDLRHLALWLTVAGGGVLMMGLAGGWWMATRAIRPIEEISVTAEKISTGNLSERIPASDTDSEFGQLAKVLNTMFARLDAAFTQQARFTSDAAHELRTPLTVMLTQTQAALARERSAPEYRESVEACQRAAQRMRRLTESLLELARLDAGQESIKRERVDLSRIARESIELVRPLMADRGITFQMDLAAAVSLADADRLGQVVTNLLSNAIYYNKRHGEVRITTRTEGSVAVLTVEDTGPGIVAEDIPHIFERFFRAEKSRSTAGRTGLGLAICKAIIDAHGGTIEVSSEVGRGARFTLRLG